MEQFHAAPTSQWNVITKMIDECDFYLLVIGARYGSIDEETGISYTEKEYNYAKNKGLPVLVLIKQSSAISENEKDTGNDKYEKMKRLDEFRERVKNDKNTVDFFTDLNSLKMCIRDRYCRCRPWRPGPYRPPGTASPRPRRLLSYEKASPKSP